VLGADTVRGPLVIAKYDAAGNALWGKGISGALNDNQINSISVDHLGNFLLCGQMNTTGPSPGYVLDLSGHSLVEPAGCKYPIYIARYDTSGNYISSSCLVSGGGGYQAIATDNFGNFFIEGDYIYGPPNMVFGPDTIYNMMGTAIVFIARNKYDTVASIPLTVAKVGGGINYITLYPNPAEDELTIVSTEKITSVTILNLVGQKVHCGNYNTNELHINVSDLPAGVYLVRINDSEVRRFVKQ
jgi:hypothetical protein